MRQIKRQPFLSETGDMRQVLCFVASAALLTGCAAANYVPTPYATGPKSVVAGHCKLMAINGGTVDTSISAYGSPRFVALAAGSAAVAGVIGTAIRQSSIYDACMQANGFTPAPVNEAVATAPPPLRAAAPPTPNLAYRQPYQPPPVAAYASPAPSEQGLGPDPEFQWAPSGSVSVLGN